MPGGSPHRRQGAGRGWGGSRRARSPLLPPGSRSGARSGRSSCPPRGAGRHRSRWHGHSRRHRWHSRRPASPAGHSCSLRAVCRHMGHRQGGSAPYPHPNPPETPKTPHPPSPAQPIHVSLPTPTCGVTPNPRVSPVPCSRRQLRCRALPKKPCWHWAQRGPAVWYRQRRHCPVRGSQAPGSLVSMLLLHWQGRHAPPSVSGAPK